MRYFEVCELRRGGLRIATASVTNKHIKFKSIQEDFMILKRIQKAHLRQHNPNIPLPPRSPTPPIRLNPPHPNPMPTSKKAQTQRERHSNHRNDRLKNERPVHVSRGIFRAIVCRAITYAWIAKSVGNEDEDPAKELSACPADGRCYFGGNGVCYLGHVFENYGHQTERCSAQYREDSVSGG